MVPLALEPHRFLMGEALARNAPGHLKLEDHASPFWSLSCLGLFLLHCELGSSHNALRQMCDI